MALGVSRMKGETLWKIVAGLITLVSLVVGLTRHIDTLESRIQRLEDKERYLHGSFAVPKE
jgi:hypothetical protein